MKLHHSLLCAAAAIALGTPAVALAQATVDQGYYIGAQAGVDWADKTDLKSTAGTDHASFQSSPTGIIDGGYKFGNGVRVGVEVGYGGSTVGDITGPGPGRAGGAGEVTAFTFMANTYYDFKVDGPLRPYVGVGIGFGRYKFDGVGDLYTPGNVVETSTTAFTYQAEAGVAYAMSPNLEFTVGYRFMGTPETTYDPSGAPSFKAAYQSHSVLVGLRYTFGAASEPPAPPAPPPPPPPPVAKPVPPPPPPPAPSISRNFTVFFDWDKTDLSADARTVLDNAAKDAATGHITKIQVTGYTDRSGTDAYNLKLSVRRAEAVKAYLASKGVGASIATDGKGETDPLVPTADGVREPSNRRAVIIFP